MEKFDNNKIHLKDNNYLMYSKSFNMNFFKSIINIDTSIIYLGEDSETLSQIFKLCINNSFDNLILLNNTSKLSKNKKVFRSKFITKKILDSVKKKIVIIINISDNYKIMKNIIKNLLLIEQYCSNMNLSIVNNCENIDIWAYIIGEQSKYLPELKHTFFTFLLKNKKEVYEYIYDTVCDYMDNEFKERNLCDFKSNKCVASRNNCTSHEEMGCCYSFEYPTCIFDPRPERNIQLCEHLKNNSCTAKCITCKIFTCNYLKSKGIHYYVNELLLLDCFFDKKQKLILEYNFFKTREQIIEKLLEKNNTLSIFYFLLNKYRVKN